jgi:hypothetical protein
MKRGGVWFGVLLALAACEEPPAPATLSEVPAQFVGVWDISLEACDAVGGATSVVVRSDEVTFSDSHLAVTGASPDGDRAVRVDGHFTGPGIAWNGSVRLELGEGGQELSVVNGSLVVPRVKCP